jgi:hypothetical protein
MRGVNRYYTPTAAQPVFSQEPLEYLRLGLEAKQQRYDMYQGLADELYNMNVDTLDPDRAGANTKILGYQQNIDSLIDEYKGDYSNMGGALHKLGRNMLKDFSPGGQLHAMERQKQRFDKDDALYKGLVANGKISSDQYNAWRSHSLSNYAGKGGVGEVDPLTQAYAQIDLPTITKPYEVNELVDYFAKNIIPAKFSKGGPWRMDDNGLIWRKTIHGEEEVTRDRIKDIVRKGVETHDGFMDYYDQMREFGTPLDDKDIDMAIDRAVDTYAYKHTEDDEDIRFTPGATLKALYGEDAEGKLIPPEYKDSGRNIPGFSSRVDINKVIDPPENRVIYTDQKDSYNTKVDIQRGKEALVADKEAEMARRAKVGFLNDYIDSGKAAKDGVDVGNFKAFIQEMEATGLEEYSQYTADGTKKLLEEWNTIIDNSDLFRPTRTALAPGAIQSLNDYYFGDIGGINAGHLTVPLDGKHVEPMSLKDSLKELDIDYEHLTGKDDNGNRWASVIAIEAAENGYISDGYVINVRKKDGSNVQFLVEGRDGTLKELYAPITRSASLIHTPHLTRGTIERGIPGLEFIPEKRLRKISNGDPEKGIPPKYAYELALISPKDNMPITTQVGFDNNGEPLYRNLQLNDLRKILDKDFIDEKMPTGASKADNTDFEPKI